MRNKIKENKNINLVDSFLQNIEKEELKIFLKDILEPEVDEKYFLKQEKIEKLLPNQEVSYCIDANYVKGTNVKQFIKKRRRQLIQLNHPVHSNDRVYSEEGCSPALNTMQGGNRQPFIAASRGRYGEDGKTYQNIEPRNDGATNSITTVQKDNYVCVVNATKKGYLKARDGDGVNLEQPNSKTRRGRVQIQTSSTLQCNDARGVITPDLTIRKLTPTECFRLMGFLDDEIKLEDISNSQRYKLAGNGWDQNLVSKIFVCMFKNTY